MRVSVIVSTYNQPRWLELVLWGYAAQSHRGFEVVVADDGSGPETRDVIRRMAAETGLALVHAWHEDRGFRKTEILNRAILAASGDYLVFTDGDTIPGPGFVETHVREARPGCYLGGSYLRLSPEVSAAVTADAVRTGRVASLAWLRAHGWRPGRKALRLVRWPWAAALLDGLSRVPAPWRGNNSSAWREHVLAANGFEMEMGYGGEDTEFGVRLRNLGVRARRIRFRAPAFHLHHPRPYRDPAAIERNRQILAEVRRTRRTRARQGIAELRDAGVPLA